ncbi:hypothetical protein JCM17846_07140 [Iodidimonas nitroreducens]|uniref:Flagellar protein FliL n=1 Tax=Iodidimonas nitroreducens TaxID=1236968 RepID=A0A5A7N435_9PROT|nr:flagellar basal body-associated FliL family protein [Iodidimonas nitroreducens]GAK32875.1 flagellar FliL protein [alpha proteobacterium Q-1]GER03032.1 hypothetical protein JCM17846_07140 [Iodidimonas nitroreducens]
MADDDNLDDDLAGDLGDMPQTKKFSGKKIILIAVPALVVLIAIIVVLTMLMGGKEEPIAEDKPVKEQIQLIFIDLPEMVVNLNTGERQQQFLRARISLEVDRESARAAVEEKMPRIIDDFQVYLRELRVQDLNGSAGLYRLKEELLVRINTSVAPVEVKDVLFREMLVQ